MATLIDMIKGALGETANTVVPDSSVEPLKPEPAPIDMHEPEPRTEPKPEPAGDNSLLISQLQQQVKELQAANQALLASTPIEKEPEIEDLIYSIATMTAPQKEEGGEE